MVTLIYMPGISAMESELVFRSLDGKEEVLPLKSDYYGQFNISPDGEKIAISNHEYWGHLCLRYQKPNDDPFNP